MNSTSRAILQTVLSTDSSLAATERETVQRLIDGEAAPPAARAPRTDEQLLVNQKVAAKILGVSRVTIWRMTKECVLHPVELLPGSFRYRYRELADLALRDAGAPEQTREVRQVA